VSIEVSQVTKLYGDQKALNNVTFSVSPGQILGFLGPNGAGKSTMMKIITTYVPPTHGKVVVNGFDVNEAPLEVRKHVGYLPEHNPLYLDMYVREYLEFIAGLHGYTGNIKNRVNEMIDSTGLGVEKHKKIGALSKGFRQRVGLAQAMIHDPKVLILDEPTTGLDPNQLAEIRNLIKEIGKHKTVMLSTHIMQEVKAICDRVIIINKGEIVADSSTELLQNQNNASAVITVEFDKSISPGLIEKIPGVKNVQSSGNNSWKITASGEKDIRGEIFNFAVKNELQVLSMTREEQSLEAIFQKLTSK
jgi:ABC-2 type transport system ATP-binding protein